MDGATITAIISAAGVALALIIARTIKAAREKDNVDPVCVYNSAEAHEQTILLRDIRDSLRDKHLTDKYEFSAIRESITDLKAMTRAEHKRIDAVEDRLESQIAMRESRKQ